VRLLIEGLSVSYGARRVLNGVNMSVSAGMMVAVIGPNGAGKSTLLRAVLGLLPCEGHVRLDGMDLHTMRPGDIARRVSYLPQDNAVRSALTVLEVVLLGRLEKLGWHLPRDEVEVAIDALERLDVAHLAARPIGELSGGQRQLVFLAQALARRPALLLLDEPTGALDLKHQLTVLQILRAIAAEGGPAVIAVMHDLNLAARVADQLAVLHGGRVHSAGRPSKVLTTRMLAEVFEVEAELTSAIQNPSIVVPIRALPSSLE
jgi:iron complex transport system ATP-binding protein